MLSHLNVDDGLVCRLRRLVALAVPLQAGLANVLFAVKITAAKDGLRVGLEQL